MRKDKVIRFLLARDLQKTKKMPKKELQNIYFILTSGTIFYFILATFLLIGFPIHIFNSYGFNFQSILVTLIILVFFLSCIVARYKPFKENKIKLVINKGSRVLILIFLYAGIYLLGKIILTTFSFGILFSLFLLIFVSVEVIKELISH